MPAQQWRVMGQVPELEREQVPGPGPGQEWIPILKEVIHVGRALR